MKSQYSILFYLLALVLLISCSDSTSADEEDNGEDIAALIAEIKTATQTYHDVNAAKSAGWNVVMSPCVAHPEEGGMGYHYGKMEFFDGRINHLEPQVLLYEPLEGGGLEFVGVEYIIPFDVLPASSEPPVILGENYHQNHDLGIWALHVWTEKENPNGMFNDWNPNVSCQYETDVMIREIREVTETYHDLDNAMADGWNTFLSPCVEHPEEGGMGYHVARMEFIDGRINHKEPQILLYEPLEDGGMKFVGVEFIIPFDIHPSDAEPPLILGEHYHQNHQLGIWALHVWTEKENPNGMFYDWNPNVSCQYANDE